MCREDKCLLAAVVPPSAAHGGCGWEQRPLPAVTSHTEPSRALPGLCWGFHTAHRLQGSAAPLLPPCPLLTPSALPRSSGASLWVRGISSSVAGQLQRACLASSHLPGAPKVGSCLAPTLLRLGMPSSRAQGCPMDAPALEDVPWMPGARI